MPRKAACLWCTFTRHLVWKDFARLQLFGNSEPNNIAKIAPSFIYFQTTSFFSWFDPWLCIRSQKLRGYTTLRLEQRTSKHLNMSDVEDELLALAGGDVSSDEEDQAIIHRDQTDSPAKDTASERDAKKPPGREKHDESEEEGEAYVCSARSVLMLDHTTIEPIFVAIRQC